MNSQDFRESLSSFWARVDGFKDQQALDELRPKGGLARTWTVRGTMHTFPARDYYLHVFGSPRKRILSRYESYAKKLGVPPLETRMDRMYQPLLDEIRGRTVTSSFIKEFVSARLTRLGVKAKRKLRRGWSSTPTMGPAWAGITEMSYLGLIVGAGRRGSESLWARTSDWLGVGRKVPEPEECVAGLVRKYVEAYGPVTRMDVYMWSGLTMKEVTAALEALKSDLQETRLEGVVHYDTGYAPSDARPPIATVLPEFDSLTMGYKDRSRFLPKELTGEVFRPQGVVAPTILIDGFVGATWRRKKDGKRAIVQISPLTEMNSTVKRSIQERFEDYAAYQGTDMQLSFVARQRI